jgi:zinc/manganese transport system substrate-binding protein
MTCSSGATNGIQSLLSGQSPNEFSCLSSIHICGTVGRLENHRFYCGLSLANVAGDLVDLTIIVGPDGDSEEYEPTAADVPKMANARILFMNGLNDDFEPWLDSLMKQSRFDGTKVIVSRGVKGLSAEDEHPMGGKPKAIKLDQHAWMNPKNGLTYVKNITDALVRLDPANGAEYRNRAASYTQELRDLNAWAQAEMAAVPAAKPSFPLLLNLRD